MAKRKPDNSAKCKLSLEIDYDPKLTDPEGLATAMDILTETALSTPDILGDYGKPEVGKFEVLEPVLLGPLTAEQKQVPPGHKINYETLLQAFKQGDVCSTACRDRTTGKMVTLLCAVNREPNNHVQLAPMAVLLPMDADDQNPYQRFIPPGEPGNE